MPLQRSHSRFLWTLSVALLVGFGVAAYWLSVDSDPVLWRSPESARSNSVVQMPDANRSQQGRTDPVAPAANREPDTSPVPVIEPPPAKPDPPPSDPLTQQTPKVSANANPDRPPDNPVLDLNLTDADYRRIEEDASETQETRDQARSRLKFRFALWRGRASRRLGGFSWKLTDYPMLDGIEQISDRLWDEGRTSAAGKWMVMRNLQFEGDGRSVQISVTCTQSIGWAQQGLLALLAGSAVDQSERWGDLSNISLADVCFCGASEASGEAESGMILFTRNNILVQVQHLCVEGRTFNGLQLAQAIDRQIQDQSVEADTWEQLSAHRPVFEVLKFPVDHFLDDDSLRTFTGTAEVHPAKGQANCHVSKPHWPDGPIRFSFKAGKSVPLQVTMEAGVRDVSKDLRVKAYHKPCNAWLMAYQENLLFTVAEIKFTIRPDGWTPD